MIARGIMRHYPGTTVLDIEKMTLDQLSVYFGDDTGRKGNVIYKSPAELASMGVIQQETGSLAQLMETQIAETRERERSTSKFARRSYKESQRR